MYRILLLLLTLCAVAACRPPHPAALPAAVTAASGSGEAEVVGRAALPYEKGRRFDQLFLESVRQKEADHIDAQAELLRAALAIAPDASEALYELGVLRLSYSPYSDSPGRAEGDSLLRRAVQLAPGNLHYKETLATYLANRADYRESIGLYEEIADARLTQETLAMLIWLYKTSGDYAGAIRTIERLERLEGRSEQLSLEKFQTYLAMKDDEHAYQAIEDLCAEYPLDLRYRVLLGDLYDQNGYHERALDIYRDVLTAEPDNSYAQISLLAYYKAAGADSLYLDLLNRVVLNPHTQGAARVEALRAYAVDNLKTGADSVPVLRLFHRVLAEPQENRDVAELMAYYMVERHMPVDSLCAAMETILRIEPDYTKARFQLLQFMIERDDMVEVARICREGELYEPNEILFYYYEGTALYMLGRNDEAIRRLQLGAERVDETSDPIVASDMLGQLGDALHERGLKADAYAAYDRALHYNERNLLCLNNYAYFLALDGTRLDDAARMSRLTVETEPENGTYLDTYAWVLYLQRQYTQARIYIDEALRFTPEEAANASIFDHAGDIYFRLGDRTAALSFWRKALSLTDDASLRAKVQRKVRRRRL